jgi:hypothetical protein
MTLDRNPSTMKKRELKLFEKHKAIVHEYFKGEKPSKLSK